MATYRIEMMTSSNYYNYRNGGNYSVSKIDIEAGSTEEAVEIAKKNNPCMVINEGYVKTLAELEELEEWKAKRNAEYKAYLKAKVEKMDKAKTREAEREKEKAEALGLTVEEYKAKVKHDKKVRDAEARIAELKAELAREEKYLEELKKGA